ncbi:MAG: hypothetical protein ACO3JL_18240, partial [Myxococcota bacterium]
CQSCGSMEHLAERFMAGRTSTLRCAVCRGLQVGNVMSYETRRYWAVIATQICGPFTARELKVLVEHGEVHGESWLWTWDMLGWERVVDSARLAFVAAFVRDLTRPVLELVETVNDDDNATMEQEEISTLLEQNRLPLSDRHPALAEMALYAAIALCAATFMGGGLVAGATLLA